MSDERVPYIKRLEDQLIRETKTIEAYLVALNEANTARYDRPAAAKKADKVMAELQKEITNAKSILGGKYA